MMKAALFPNLGPPPSPHTMLLHGGHHGQTDPTLYWGEGEMLKLSKKAKCTNTFGQDCGFCSLTRRAYYIIELLYNTI